MITDAEIAKKLKKFDNATTRHKLNAILKGGDLLARFVMHGTIKIYYDTYLTLKEKEASIKGTQTKSVRKRRK
jgi:hypothetical protein